MPAARCPVPPPVTPQPEAPSCRGGPGTPCVALRRPGRDGTFGQVAMTWSATTGGAYPVRSGPTMPLRSAQGPKGRAPSLMSHGPLTTPRQAIAALSLPLPRHPLPERHVRGSDEAALYNRQTLSKEHVQLVTSSFPLEMRPYKAAMRTILQQTSSWCILCPWPCLIVHDNDTVVLHYSWFAGTKLPCWQRISRCCCANQHHLGEPCCDYRTARRVGPSCKQSISRRLQDSEVLGATGGWSWLGLGISLQHGRPVFRPATQPHSNLYDGSTPGE
jgi:hypothetical protein